MKLLLLFFISSVSLCKTYDVTIQNSKFQPNVLEIHKGDTVRWTNKDVVAHTVTSGVPGHPYKIFNSGYMFLNKTFSFTFTKVDEYPYFCIPHSYMMKGMVIVK